MHANILRDVQYPRTLRQKARNCVRSRSIHARTHDSNLTRESDGECAAQNEDEGRENRRRNNGVWVLSVRQIHDSSRPHPCAAGPDGTSLNSTINLP